MSRLGLRLAMRLCAAPSGSRRRNERGSVRAAREQRPQGCRRLASTLITKFACGRDRPANLSFTFVAIPYLRIDERRHMTDTVGIAGDRIRSFIERIEHIDEEIKALNEGKKEVFSGAKAEDFDVKVLKEIFASQEKGRARRTRIATRPLSQGDGDNGIPASEGGVRLRARKEGASFRPPYLFTQTLKPRSSDRLFCG